MRSIPELVESFRGQLTQDNAQLRNFKDYGNLYFLVRAFSALLNEQEQNITERIKQAHLDTATGVDLDRIGLTYGIERRASKQAEGYVLIYAEDNQVIQAGAVLTDFTGNFRLIIQEALEASNVEQAVLVRSVSGESIFIPPGTELRNEFYPRVDFIVGAYRNILNEPEEAIVGGVLEETDEDYRQRISLTLDRLETSDLELLINLLDEFGLTPRVFIVNNDPRIGYFTLYMDSNDASTRDAYEQLILDNAIPGMQFRIKTLNILELEFQVAVRFYSLNFTEQSKNLIANIINNYLNSLLPGDTVNLKEIESLIYQIDNINEVEIITPAFDQELADAQVPKLQSLTINLAL